MTGMATARIGTLDDAQAWAAEIARLAPPSLRHSKRVLNDDGRLCEVWPALHSEMFDKAWASRDVIEGAGRPRRETGPELPRAPGDAVIAQVVRLAGGGVALAAGLVPGRARRPRRVGCRRRRDPPPPPRARRTTATASSSTRTSVDHQPDARGAAHAGTRSVPAGRDTAPGRVPRPARLLRCGSRSRCHLVRSLQCAGDRRYRVLADPVWASAARRRRPSASAAASGPGGLDTLPALDAVIISHDHYDHLDVETIWSLARTQRCSSSCHWGLGRTCATGELPLERIVELDRGWRGRGRRAAHRLYARTPLLRTVPDAQHPLWSSWAMIGPRHRAFFGGDTGYTGSFADIGEAHGPFDLTLMPVGAHPSRMAGTST